MPSIARQTIRVPILGATAQGMMKMTANSSVVPLEKGHESATKDNLDYACEDLLDDSSTKDLG